DVMRQVRVREAESKLTTKLTARPAGLNWPRRLAIAATIAAGFTGTLLVNRDGRTASPELLVPIAATHVAQKTFAAKPIVETYESQNATIVEVPAEQAGDNVQMVMIFDENLPADL